jgi:hypothetical protein
MPRPARHRIAPGLASVHDARSSDGVSGRPRALEGSMTIGKRIGAASLAIVLAIAVADAGQPPTLGYDDTPMQPDGRWRIHDATRPQPIVVSPGPAPVNPVPAPADAIVLLGARDSLSAWQMIDGSAPTWAIANGVVETRKGMMRTREEFTDFQLHVEFATPREVKGDSQGRGNSGGCCP